MASSTQKILHSPRLHQLFYVGALAWIALLGAVRVTAQGTVPWGWIVAFALVAFFLAGPATWAVRDRYSEERRSTLAYLVGGTVLLAAPIVLGLAFLTGGALLLLDAGALGGAVGFALAFGVERTIVPDRLRSEWG